VERANPGFDFGELALYAGSVLLGIAVSQTVIHKPGPGTGTDGQPLRIDFFVDLTPGQILAVGQVSGQETSFARVNSVDQLVPPAVNGANAFVVAQQDAREPTFMAFADPFGFWGFSSKPYVHYQGTIETQSAFGCTADVEGSYNGVAEDLVLQFVSGPLKGYCRRLTRIGSDGIITWATQVRELPWTGDKFIVLGPMNSAMIGVGPTGPTGIRGPTGNPVQRVRCVHELRLVPGVLLVQLFQSVPSPRWGPWIQEALSVRCVHEPRMVRLDPLHETL
jgi:hypothetical protein